MFVRPKNREERVMLLDFLESEGFYYWPEGNCREETETSPFPVTVNPRLMQVGHIGNVTCAAASVRHHISAEEFYRQYKQTKGYCYSPVVIHVPHASVLIPDDEMDAFIIDDLDDELLKMTDHYCDELFECKHEMLKFAYSRLVCDVERFRDDKNEPMAARGMGFAYTHGSSLQKIRELSPDHRYYGIELCYYKPHHDELECMVRRRLVEHKRCLIIDGHSFPGEPLPYEMNVSLDRPDICIGTDKYHTSESLIEKTKQFFEGKGYRVAVNSPFSGSIVPQKYYRKDSRVQSIMIEINRDLYMDNQANKTEGFAIIKSDLREYLDGAITPETV